MDSDIAIKVEHVSKKFCKSLKRGMLYGIGDILRNSLGMSTHSDRLRKGEFWAVDDVSFEVRKGETLGIIGPNGSGKTTLLKMLNGIFWPDKGKITVNGRVGALIAVGAGFHPMLTGRENIYINAAILGMTKKEVDEKFDDIVEFADIGDFLDTPVKFYSSGMYVRLGFAVAVHCEPDILLVDEVLAVGDSDFRAKCYRRIHEIKEQGKVIIIVSHDQNAIRAHTEKCVFLKTGKVAFIGDSDSAVTEYIEDILRKKAYENNQELTRTQNNQKKATIEFVEFLDAEDNNTTAVECGGFLKIKIRCNVITEISSPVFDFIFDDNAGFVYCANSEYEGITFGPLKTGHRTIELSIPNLYLPINSYSCCAQISEKTLENFIDSVIVPQRIVIKRAENSRGSLKLPIAWSVR